ncbi:MAG: hypothetical protein L3J10_08585 [Sulfurimonas sp.]|nr:hypothetical protein [Sulfurimonas sp.]
MSTVQIKNEVENIYNALNISKKPILLMCPILKILQMRYHSVDKAHAKNIIKNFLKNKG